MKYLKFRMYGAGLSNQRLSLEMGVAYAHLTGRTLVPYNFKLLVHSGKALRGDGSDYNITQLFELPVPVLCEKQFEELHSSLPSHEVYLPRMSRGVYVEELATEGAQFEDFIARREVVIVRFSKEQLSSPVIDLGGTRNFCQFSSHFFLSEHRRRQLIEVLNQITPRAEYLEMANEICKLLGHFSAIHVRQGDFLNKHHAFDIADPGTLLNNVSAIIPATDLLVVSTDQEDSANFERLKDCYPRLIFLESFIRDTPEIAVLYAKLPHRDEAVMGLICQLVCVQADKFAGSLRSTFTGYIHRLRRETNMLFVNSVKRPNLLIKNGAFVETQPGRFYTWLKTGWSLDVDPYTVGWMREWPESLL